MNPIQKCWKRYKRDIFNKDTNEKLIEAFRHAFFAGATSSFQDMVYRLNKDSRSFERGILYQIKEFDEYHKSLGCMGIHLP